MVNMKYVVPSGLAINFSVLSTDIICLLAFSTHYSHDIVIIGKGLPGSDIIENAKWVEVKTCNNRIFINSLLDYVQIGEAEALTLALELQADTIIVDEAAARNLAEQFGLNFTGLLGILIKAKEHGLIPSVKPLMDALRTKARFFIHQSLYNQVLAIAKEEP